MRTTFNLRPEAWQVVQTLARHRRKSMGEVVSDLILDGVAGKKTRVKFRHGIPQLPKTGIPITTEEVRQALEDEE